MTVLPSPRLRQLRGRQPGDAAGGGAEAEGHRGGAAGRGRGGGGPGAGGALLQDLPPAGPPSAGPGPLQPVPLQPGQPPHTHTH